MKKLYLVVLCIILAVPIAYAQSSKKRKSPVAYNKQNDENEKFLNKQWWLGVKGGINLSQVNVETTFSVVSPANYTLTGSGKKYDKFKHIGSQIGFEITFYLKGFSFSLQPTYQHTRFVYFNEYSWTSSSNANDRLELMYEQEQNLGHLQLPFIIKYELTGNKIRPYVQIGAYTAHLLSANKSIILSGVDYASGGENEFKDEPIIVGAKDLFARNHWGLIGGLGVYYNVGNVRLNLDVQYKYGMSNISSTKNRYSNDRLAGVGDAMDDLTLDNLAISVGCLFPLRFLENGFKSLDRK
jgi:hypothetical protein